MVRTFKDSRTQEQAFYIVPSIKVKGKVHHFLYLKGGPLNIVSLSGDAIGTIIDTVIGQ
tara:strand:- start:61657 stop:61833 length:177 start_codon:yes stop_codon:yes gene_type:complete